MNSKDILARLLAEEDISVVRKSVSTASFDVQHRVLTLPVWEGMGPDVEDMNIAHEIAHAKWSPLSMLLDDNGNIVSYTRKTIINILEDNRIERLIKKLYPIYNSIFYSGYKELYQKHFFGTEEPVLYMDKVNRLSKLGTLCDITFTGKQLDLFDRINSTQTPKDVLDLVDEVIAIEKEMAKPKEKEPALIMPTETSYEVIVSDPDEEQDEEPGEDSQPGESAGSGDNSDLQEPTESDAELTDEELADLIKDNSEYDKFVDQLAKKTSNKVIDNFKSTDYVNILGKDVLEIESVLDNLTHSKAYGLGLYEDFIANTNKLAEIMYKEFEMRKSAARHTRTKEHKTGELNTNRLHNYKISDNIFRTIQTCENDKNHGMIVLVDWSSSMENVMPKVINQLITLASFCRKAKLPFKVYAFSDYRALTDNNSPPPSHTKLNIEIKLIKLFDETQSQETFNKVAEILYNKGYASNKLLNLSATPLNFALFLINDVLSKFKQQHNLDKTSLILLSDGEDTGQFADANIRDSVTGKYYLTDKKRGSTATRNKLIEVIKDRNKCDIIVFYISSSLTSGISTMESYADSTRQYFRREPTGLELLKFTTESILEFTLPNINKFYIIDDDSLTIEQKSISEITSDMTVHKMHKILSKSGLSKESVIIMKKLINNIA